MNSYITKIRENEIIDYMGKKFLVISIHKFLARLMDIETKFITCANIGDLVIAGIESPDVLLIQNRKRGIV